MHYKTNTVIYTIIVTYNGKQWIRKCLKNLNESTIRCHVIVIDNASEDDTVSIIFNEFPETEILKNSENKGFGAANNIAMQIALQRNADYIFLLNQDVYVEKNTIEQLITLVNQNKDYGIISPVQLNGDGTAIEVSFKTYLQRVLNAEEVNAVEQRKKSNAEIIPVRFANAAAWLLPLEVIKKTGLFHPLFFSLRRG